MSADPGSLASQVAALRQHFDASFAEEALQPAHDLVALLLVRTSSGPQAVPIRELVSVEPCPALVPLPGQHHALIGLAGTRGRPTTVFSLDRLQGAIGSEAPPRWLLFIQPQVAVAVSGIDGHRQVAPEAVLRDGDRRTQPLVQAGDASWPLVDLTALVTPLLSSVSSVTSEPLRSTTP